MNSTNETCAALQLTEGLYVVVLPIIQVLINVFVSIAAIRYRQKLRSNYVYIYVVSKLSANSIFGIVYLYSLLNQVYGIERIWTPVPTFRIDHNNSRHVSLRSWWGFRVAFLVSLFLTTSASLSSLMYGLRESAYFVGPALRLRDEEKDKQLSIAQKRRRALLITAITWIVPMLLAFVASVSWNCLRLCRCFDAYYGNMERCQTGTHLECSKLFPPLSNGYLATSVITWCLLTAAMFATLLRTIYKFRIVTDPRRSRVSDVINATDATDVVESTQTCDMVNETSSQLRRPPISPTIKCMVILSVMFTVCSAPSMVVIAVDITQRDPSKETSLYAVMLGHAAFLIYCISSPFVLVQYMSGLRRAVLSLLHCCRCSTVKKVKSPSARSSRQRQTA